MGMVVGSIIIGATALIGGALASSSAKKGRDQLAEMQTQADTQASEQLAFQREQAQILELQKQEYRDFEFKNPYADLTNPYASMTNAYADLADDYDNLTNPYAGMQNTYEDLQVSTVAADFQMEQAAQQRANIMESLSGAAGGSGIAALAQSLANQGTMQARQVSADLAQQQARNEQLAARGAMDVQRLQAQGDFAVQQAQLAGAQQIAAGDMAVQQAQAQGQAAVDMAIAGGASMQQQMEAQRQSTLLGMEYAGMAGANQSVQQAYANQMAIGTGLSQMQMQQAGMYASLGGQALSAFATAAGPIPTS
tara:strand:+ start:1556 stop:2482 length:927 start_codon:yes stop_codon:yes gene_type:complete